MPIFGHLDTLPIRIWDESRSAMNAYEMFHDKDYIVTHFEGKPDMWNTKPPLLIWAQVFFMKLIGANELSVRLPSAIAAFLTCIVLLFFSVRYIKEFWLGFIAIIVLITSSGYINIHATRTGDYDALLAFFTTMSGLFFFVFMETKNNKYIYLFFLSITLAVLTKSIMGVMFVPAMVIYALWQKQFLSLLKNKHFYAGLISFLIIIAGYYWIREIRNPGYIAAVQLNELGGRYLNVIESHKCGFWYYYTNFIDFQLSKWYLLVPCGLVIGLLHKDPKIKKITLFAALMILTYFMIISTAQTKLEWYDVPMYPFIALLIAIFVFYIFNLLKQINWTTFNLSSNYIVSFIFLFLLSITPYRRILDKTYFPQENSWDKDFYEIGYFLKDAVKGKQDVDHYFLLYSGYSAQNLFYLGILHDKGVNIKLKDWKALDKGDKVIVQQQNIKDFLNNNYILENIAQINNVIKYRIVDKKIDNEISKQIK